MLLKVILFIHFSINLDVNKGDELNIDKHFKHVGFQYKGEKFPIKYLLFNNTRSSASDLRTYVTKLKQVLDHFSLDYNKTDPNVALGMYFTKGILKRTLKENKFTNDNLKTLEQLLKKIIYVSEIIVSHFKFSIMFSDVEYIFPRDVRKKLYNIFDDDDPVVYSVRNFSRGSLVKWIYSSKNVHEHIDQMDEGTYPKIEFFKLMTQMNDIFPVDISDACFSKVTDNPEPIHMEEMRPCKPDPVCKAAAMNTPSYAYIISHRLLILLSRHFMRRCYVLSSPEMDNLYMEFLCANMYREVVYMARRGFFTRDLFLEHISLCGLYGYEEFHRRAWFVKAASWVDENGCVEENRNSNINQYNVKIESETSPEKKKILRKIRSINLNSDCHSHPMALMAFTLAHGIRHALHYLTNSSLETINWSLLS